MFVTQLDFNTVLFTISFRQAGYRPVTSQLQSCSPVTKWSSWHHFGPKSSSKTSSSAHSFLSTSAEMGSRRCFRIASSTVLGSASGVFLTRWRLDFCSRQCAAAFLWSGVSCRSRSSNFSMASKWSLRIPTIG